MLLVPTARSKYFLVKQKDNSMESNSCRTNPMLKAPAKEKTLEFIVPANHLLGRSP